MFLVYAKDKSFNIDLLKLQLWSLNQLLTLQQTVFIIFVFFMFKLTVNNDDDETKFPSWYNFQCIYKPYARHIIMTIIIICRQTIYSSQSLWRIWVPSALPLWSSWENLTVGWVASLEKSERPAFFSSACLLQYNVLIRCFCTMASLMTFQTSNHFSCFYLFLF